MGERNGWVNGKNRTENAGKVCGPSQDLRFDLRTFCLFSVIRVGNCLPIKSYFKITFFKRREIDQNQPTVLLICICFLKLTTTNWVNKTRKKINFAGNFSEIVAVLAIL